MKKLGIFAGSTAVLTAGLSIFAFAAGAHQTAHTRGCVRGKEAQGCKFDGTAYGDLKSRLIISFPASTSPKGTATELSMPVSSVCPKVTEEISLYAKGKGAARVGSTIAFSGKIKITSFTGSGVTATVVSSGKITGKLKISSAKKASLSGKAEVTLSDGTKCSKSLPKKMVRILGG